MSDDPVTLLPQADPAEPVKVTPSNYHDMATKREVMSHSQYRSWLECAAATKAQLAERYVPHGCNSKTYHHDVIVGPRSAALLVGSYVDRALTAPKEFDAWCIEYAADIRAADKILKSGETKTGAKYADFETADLLISRVKADPNYDVIMRNFSCQEVLRGDIGGHEWVYMADWLRSNPEDSTLLDLKTTKGFEPERGCDECPYEGEIHPKWISMEWLDAAGYWRQLAVGRELFHQKYGVWPMCGIVAATKQAPSALGLWWMDNERRFAREIEQIKRQMNELVIPWKTGKLEAKGCGFCPWCRAQTSLDNIHTAISGRTYTA